MLRPRMTTAAQGRRTEASALVLRSRPHLARRTLVVLQSKDSGSPEVKEKDTPSTSPRSDAEETTLKYGLEAGLVKTLTGKDGKDGASKADQAKQLLAQYGSAYLITSISLAIVSFTACYFAVDSGVDVNSLMAKVGLEVNTTTENVGTFAIAYAAHKALSPVRFPPTVALTPIVARWTGQKKDEDASQK